MFFIYEESKGGKSSFNIADADATDFWLRHFSNALYLRFIAQHKNTSTSEKAQANKELAIADRKMTFWAKHPNYSKERAVAGAGKLKKDWVEPA